MDTMQISIFMVIFSIVCNGCSAHRHILDKYRSVTAIVFQLPLIQLNPAAWKDSMS